MPPKFRDIEKTIEADGWKLTRQTGSHRHFVHPSKPGIVTLAGKGGEEPAEGTYRSILKQAGIKR